MPKKTSDAGQDDQQGSGGEIRLNLDRRPYLAIANQLFRHPKFKRMSMQARLHLLALWADCNEYLTDGIVHEEDLYSEGTAVGDELLGFGWLHPCEDGTNYYCHDYLKHQKSRAQVEGIRAGKASKGAAGAHERWHVKRGRFDPECQLCTDASG